MSVIGIDISTGSENIYPYMVASMNEGMSGRADCVLRSSVQGQTPFACTTIDNNHVSVGLGRAFLQGRRVYVNAATTVDLSNGVSGNKRNTLICLQYSCTEGGVESMSLVAIDGTASASTASDPTPTQGDVSSGETYQMPIIRIKKDGLNITDTEYVYTLCDTLASIANKANAKPLLWENSNPSVSFATQTITIPGLSNYDFIEVEYIDTRHNPDIRHPYTIGKNVNNKTLMGHLVYATGYKPYVPSRNIQISGNSVLFGDGYWCYADSSSWTVSNDYMIPTRIWGIVED